MKTRAFLITALASIAIGSVVDAQVPGETEPPMHALYKTTGEAHYLSPEGIPEAHDDYPSYYLFSLSPEHPGVIRIIDISTGVVTDHDYRVRETHIWWSPVDDDISSNSETWSMWYAKKTQRYAIRVDLPDSSQWLIPVQGIPW